MLPFLVLFARTCSFFVVFFLSGRISHMQPYVWNVLLPAFLFTFSDQKKLNVFSKNESTSFMFFSGTVHNPKAKIQSPKSKIQGLWILGYAKTLTWIPKTKIQNPKSNVQRSKSKGQSRKSKVQHPKSKVRSPKSKDPEPNVQIPKSLGQKQKYQTK